MAPPRKRAASEAGDVRAGEREKKPREEPREESAATRTRDDDDDDDDDDATAVRSELAVAWLKEHEPATMRWAFDLTRRNMRSMYENCPWGWSNAEKRRELNHPDALYVLRVDDDASPGGGGSGGTDAGEERASPYLGFAHYRHETEEEGGADGTGGEAVTYVYELQCEPRRRGAGVGGSVMDAVEAAATARGSERCVLTVLKSNAGARRFYERRGYVVDGESPKEEACHYVILSKALGGRGIENDPSPSWSSSDRAPSRAVADGKVMMHVTGEFWREQDGAFREALKDMEFIFDPEFKSWDRECTVRAARRLLIVAGTEGYQFSRRNLQQATRELRQLVDDQAEELELWYVFFKIKKRVQHPDPNALRDKDKRLRFVPNLNEKKEWCVEVVGKGSYAGREALKVHGFRWDGLERIWHLDKEDLRRKGYSSFAAAMRDVDRLLRQENPDLYSVRANRVGEAADSFNTANSADLLNMAKAAGLLNMARGPRREEEIAVVATRTPDEAAADRLRVAMENGDYVDLTSSATRAAPRSTPPPAKRVKREPGVGGPDRTPPPRSQSSQPTQPYAAGGSPVTPQQATTRRRPTPVTPQQATTRRRPTQERCPVHDVALVKRTARKGMPHNVGRQFITCPRNGCKAVWRWADGTLPFGEEAQERFQRHVERHGFAGYL